MKAFEYKVSTVALASDLMREFSAGGLALFETERIPFSRGARGCFGLGVRNCKEISRPLICIAAK
jgi:hypothetical protein